MRLDENGDVVIPPLTVEDIPAEAAALREEITGRLPFAPIASLLVELDRHTGFRDRFTHGSGKQARSPQLKRNLLAVLDGACGRAGARGDALRECGAGRVSSSGRRCLCTAKITCRG